MQQQKVDVVANLRKRGFHIIHASGDQSMQRYHIRYGADDTWKRCSHGTLDLIERARSRMEVLR